MKAIKNVSGENKIQRVVAAATINKRFQAILVLGSGVKGTSDSKDHRVQVGVCA